MSSPSTGITRFYYDGDDLAIESDGSGNVLRAYVHGDGADSPLIWYEAVPGGISRRFLHRDERGSITAVVDQSGNEIAVNAYDEYGIPNSSNMGRFGYTGQAWIPELGMWYYKARMYSPTLGRFMQTDPIGYESGMNSYAYAGNDPINARDPSGLQDAANNSQPPTQQSICLFDPLCILVNARSGNQFLLRWEYISVVRPPSPGDVLDRDLFMEAAESHRLAGLFLAGRQSPQDKGRCLAERRAHHNGMTAHTAQDYIKAGYLVAFNVSLRKVSANGVSLRAVADFIATVPGSGQYEIHEIKTGDARLSRNQDFVYDTGFLQVVGNSGLPIGLENGDIVPFVWLGEHRFPGCPKK